MDMGKNSALLLHYAPAMLFIARHVAQGLLVIEDSWSH